MIARILFTAALLAAAMSLPAGAADFRPDLSTLAEVPRQIVPPATVNKALALAPRKDRPLQFAVAVPARFTAADGLWQPVDAKTVSWRLRLHSAGARSLSLHFSTLELPEGAGLWLYGPDGRLLHGPYTATHVSPAGLWTPIVPGDELVVELRAPVETAGQVRLGVAQVYHGFRDFKDADGGFKSGACNIDVACSQASAWLDETRSVTRIQITTGAGSFLCSGQLVNNTGQDLTPYFLTANHCGIDDNTIASSVVLYFNFQKSQCNGGESGDLSQTMTGSTLIAGHRESDFTLIRLLAQPPESYAVYYAGWDVSAEGSNCGAGIHHPSGDEKAISLYNTPVAFASVTLSTGDEENGEQRTVEAWRVTWAKGTTESGSSGSGLWNQQHELIGVLSGGSASCSNSSNPDFYGRLDVAWEGDGTTAGQLKAHLDPGNTGFTSVPGRDPAREPVPLGTITSTDCGNLGGGGGGGGSPSGGGFFGALPVMTFALLLGAAMWRQRRLMSS